MEDLVPTRTCWRKVKHYRLWGCMDQFVVGETIYSDLKQKTENSILKYNLLSNNMKRMSL